MSKYIISLLLCPDRFQKGLHFVPTDTSSMVELSLMERFDLMETIVPEIRGRYDPRLSSTRTDVKSVLDINQIPTHCEKDAVDPILTKLKSNRI